MPTNSPHPNLRLRGKSWFARMRIPRSLFATFHREEFVETLKTRDLDVARIRLADKLTHWGNLIDAARAAASQAEQRFVVRVPVDLLKSGRPLLLELVPEFVPVPEQS